MVDFTDGEGNIKVVTWIKGTVTGFRKPGETFKEAKARIILEAECRINANCDIRAHLKEGTV